MRKLFLIILFTSVFVGCKNEEPKKENLNAPKAIPAEFADSKYEVIGKKSLMDLEKGDINSWVSAFSDDAVYKWNNGDSLVGKVAIVKFWKDRRANVIETITFKNAIWLPINVKEPQSVEKPGIWLLGWYEVIVKYKKGKTMKQWIHTDYHFDANDKVDRVIQYIDRAVVNDALSK
ncbi:nuclear transport factor 2-like protein [Flavobacterium psychrotolerans]|nr:nuclear transport factor 2 family protein [Flavobacterium psychrotolerans]